MEKACLSEDLVLQGRKCSTAFSVRQFCPATSLNTRRGFPSNGAVSETRHNNNSVFVKRMTSSQMTSLDYGRSRGRFPAEQMSTNQRLQKKTCSQNDDVKPSDQVDSQSEGQDQTSFRLNFSSDKEPNRSYQAVQRCKDLAEKPRHTTRHTTGHLSFDGPREGRGVFKARLPACILKMKRQHASSLDKHKTAPSSVILGCFGNQKHNSIRASQTASRREQFTLQRQLQGYKNECNDSIGRINLNRRRVSVQLVRLRHKMAELETVRLAMADEHGGGKRPDVPVSIEELFLRHKGYIPDVTDKDKRPKFLPLMESKLRNITIG